jgi:RTX calcium-binding nonapeptide repeat (4 copies)
MSFRRAAVVLAAGTVALFAIDAGPAVPQGRIVIRGAISGTHLRLDVRAGRLLVRGATDGTPAGCRPATGRGLAVCSLSHVGSIEVDTGPADDKVEVLKKLPVPLTAYLGAGSDKLIGNGEPDTCYPQGTRRNRCVGGGGPDVCITGPENTDCVGGPGNDYCKAGPGSDGCWGGPGRDICLMGGGHDGCHGEGGDDRLYGGPASDRLYGGPGFDYCDGGPGRGRSQECEAGPGH